MKPEYKPNGLYIPKTKIVVASSFEGIVNDGAPECGLTSFNAYQQMEEGKGRYFGRVVEPADFHEINDSKEMRAFLALRPVVELAEDYLTVIELIKMYPDLIDGLISSAFLYASRAGSHFFCISYTRPMR